MLRFMQLSIRFLPVVLMPIVCLAQTVKDRTNQTVQADPPFSGTAFIDPDIITSSDPTTFQIVSDVGQGSRTMFDRRVNNWITVNAYLFNASFDDGLTAEIQVNPEFGSSDAALAEAQKYGPVIGLLPNALRIDLETVWIHKGTKPFGGGNNNLLIHIGQADLYAGDGFLEEIFVHEASHTSLDSYYASEPGWLAAQTADGEFISTYARDFPDREDVAESFLTYLAVRYRLDRISESVANTIFQTIPNRIAYFDSLSLDMYPLEQIGTAIERADDEVPNEFALPQNYPNPFNPTTTLRYDLPERSDAVLTIYDILGRGVRTLVRGVEEPGFKSVIWDATDNFGKPVSAGVYLYQIKASDFTQTRKMLLLR